MLNTSNMLDTEMVMQLGGLIQGKTTRAIIGESSEVPKSSHLMKSNLIIQVMTTRSKVQKFQLRMATA